MTAADTVHTWHSEYSQDKRARTHTHTHTHTHTKGPKEIYISESSVKEAQLHTNCYFMPYNSLVQQSASIYSYPQLATHTYMYSSTDTNMEAHALDMHTSVTPML